MDQYLNPVMFEEFPNEILITIMTKLYHADEIGFMNLSSTSILFRNLSGYHLFEPLAICGNCKNEMDALKRGHIKCFGLFKSNILDTQYQKKCCYLSAEYGNLKMLQFFRLTLKFEWDKLTCSMAAKNGNYTCLKFAHENDCAWDEETCTLAAKNNHIKCFKYAHRNNCPVNEKSCQWAAGLGNLSILIYAHQNNFPWDEKACIWAIINGQQRTLKYMHQNGCSLRVEKAIEYSKFCHNNKKCVTYINKYITDINHFLLFFNN